MRTALLSAVAALVLTSTYSVSSFAQHDDEDTYRAPEAGTGIACITGETTTKVRGKAR